MIDVRRLVVIHRVTRQDRPFLELPWFYHGVLVVILHRAGIPNRVCGSIMKGERTLIGYHFYIRITSNRTIHRIPVKVAGLAEVMSFSKMVDTSDKGHTFRDNEGIGMHMFLLAVSITERHILTLTEEYLKSLVAVHRILLAKRDDIREGITQAVERIKERGTHLPVHQRCLIGSRIILQFTRGIRLQKVGMHDIQAVHSTRQIRLDDERTVHGTRSNLDEVVALDGERIAPIERTMHTLYIPRQAAYTGYIY